MVHMLHPTVAMWVVGAGGNVSNPEKIAYGVGTHREHLEVTVREYAPRTSREDNVPVDENFSRPVSGKLGCSKYNQRRPDDCNRQ